MEPEERLFREKLVELRKYIAERRFDKLREILEETGNSDYQSWKANPSLDYRDVYRLLKYSPFQKVQSERGLYFQDRFLTKEQMARDRLVTKLLTAYVSAYDKKVKHSVICRYLILLPCMGTIVGFAWILGKFFQQIAGAPAGIEMTELVSFVTACVSFLGLVVSVLLIITKYFFPENDEQYITQIVKSIQENDLANKRENAKNAFPEQELPESRAVKMALMKSETDF